MALVIQKLDTPTAKSLNLAQVSWLKALDVNRLTQLVGTKKQILGWLAAYKNLKIRHAHDQHRVRVVLTMPQRTFASMYLEEVAKRAVPGTGALAAAYRKRSQRYVVQLWGEGSMHPNPKTNQMILETPCLCADLVVLLSEMKWPKK